MRAVFIGAGSLAMSTVRLLLKRGHDVVIVEQDKSVIDALTGDLECGFIHGDGSKPAILQEADPQHSDVLLCLTGSDQTNIIASLVGRSLGFSRVVTEISDPEFEHVCVELGLEDTIVPSRTIGRYLADVCEGRNPLEISVMLRDDARLHSFVLRDDQECTLGEFKLPGNSRVVCLYRDDRLVIPVENTPLEADDELVIVTDYESLDELKAMARAGEE